jgi:5-deoxy-glucuronate isomerase
MEGSSPAFKVSHSKTHPRQDLPLQERAIRKNEIVYISTVSPNPMTARPLDRCLRRAPKKGFSFGYNSAAVEGRAANRGGFDARMDFGVLRMRRGESFRTTTEKECLFVLMKGRCRITAARKSDRISRESLFEEGPSALHAGAGEAIEIKAETVSEWTVTRTANPRRMGARVYRNDESATEDRGAGLAQGACRRMVRTLFDHASRPDSNLVAGEVVNYPGRWSTYPPHHHPQPEIYHYRFTLPQGYGHCELGENVYMVRDGDTVKIPGGLDHSQVSAPGYGMYYLWVIRHLPGRPYKGFEFTAAHRWLLDPKNQGWMPRLAAASA